MDKIPILKASFLEQFECLGDKCEDTCCKGCGMQLEPQKKALYEKEAPELLDAVTKGEAELIMKRDPKTDYCVKFEGGLCGIHKKYGTKFLGDACHFYPRITRKLGEVTSMTAALSCPEVSRLALFTENPFTYVESETDRIPTITKNYLEDSSLAGKEAAEVVQSFIEIALDPSTSAERAMINVISVANSLSAIEKKNWPAAVKFLGRTAEARLPQAEPKETDQLFLVQALVALIAASKKTDRPRLDETVKSIEEALAIHIHRENFSIMKKTKADQYPALQAKWKKSAANKAAPILKKWLAAQLSMASFPFAGFGKDMKERATILGVRFATVRLALMANMTKDGSVPDDTTVVKITQSLARFLDHLADPTFSMLSYTEAGWVDEARIRALLGDF